MGPRDYVLRTTTFVVVLGCCVAGSTILWEHFVNGLLYNCTDGTRFDFFFPGDWVHNPVLAEEIVTNRTMSEPDLIKSGWTVTRLWLLWCAFAAGSVSIGFAAASLKWPSRMNQEGRSS